MIADVITLRSFGKSKMTQAEPTSALRATIVGVPLGAVLGLFLGFCLAAAKLLGDAETHSPNQLPPAPNLWVYLGVGLAAGAIVTPLLFAASCHAMRVVRSLRN